MPDLNRGPPQYGYNCLDGADHRENCDKKHTKENKTTGTAKVSCDMKTTKAADSKNKTPMTVPPEAKRVVTSNWWLDKYVRRELART